ncbi:MAG TPA: hypothetical protein VMU57_01350 [Edaphobacter sp.]|uniref:hypothetical protein n=1 Tax=Edaphobacter sp. TaxID=1934404 RepID=UPI002C0C52C5|nr:hypothetical protein [Edaphobacter sp.]HUZ93539.1 hypothetical protein [Edaphobacter sp.]
MKHPVIILIAAIVASGSFIGWRVHAMKNDPVTDVEEVYDPSISFTGGCQSLVGSAEQALGDPNMSAGSTLTVLVLGNQATADEPRRLGTYAIPTVRKVIEGRQASAERRESLLRNLWARCQSLQPTAISPIFLGVQQAIAELRADGCKAGSHCALWVSTDLEENGVRAIEERINSGRKVRSALPAPLDNTGIAVTLCGFAQTSGHLIGPSGREIGKPTIRDPHRDNRLQAVWRSLFTQPGLVRFEPYCPKPGILPGAWSARRTAEAR